jgi:hypothetical protein
MKAPKNIRRTYPSGAAGTGHFEVIKTVSSMKASENDSRKDLVPKRVETPTPAYTPAPTFASASSFGGASASSFGAPAASSFGAPAPSSFGNPAASSFGAPAPVSAPEAPAPAAAPTVSNEATQKRRPTDDGMDMFRSMAKNIKK